MSGSGGPQGRTIVITGAASGIGRALALGFASEKARVIAADINEAGLAAIEGPAILARRTDVTKKADIDAMIAFALAETGRLDVLFNNAGIGHGKLIEDFEPGYYERFMAVHVFGAVYGLQAAIPVMKRQNYGRIINTLSRNAEVDRKGMSAYGSAKAALWHVTRTAACEVAEHDILVNGLIPGFTRTGMTQGVPNTQEPEIVYPHARFMACLPAGGPTGKVFWNSREYPMFAPPEDPRKAAAAAAALDPL